MEKLGQLKRLPLRQVWPHEALDFTPWLADNISALGETLGIDLELEEAEASVGDFALDILARDLGSGRAVIIENQLTQTDHDHLGKLMTYAAGQDASVVVWICESIREEHRQALDWLNQVTDVDVHFFGVVIEVLQIDQSAPAYNFRTVVFPNEWQKTQKKAGKPSSSRGELYRAYFQRLLDELRAKRFTNAQAAQPQNWYVFSSGVSGLVYGHSFSTGNQVRVELYIDVGDVERNKEIFDQLMSEANDIESALGVRLTWERMENRRASRIALYRAGSITDSQQGLDDIHDWAVAELLKFRDVFGERIKTQF